MSGRLTASEVARIHSRLALVVHPGTTKQRALRTADAEREDQKAFALAKARQEYPGAPLGWLNHSTKTITLIPREDRP